MVFDKRENEEIRVIVALVNAQRQRNAGSSAATLQKLGLELGFQELVPAP
jgi:hypothetical protein